MFEVQVAGCPACLPKISVAELALFCDLLNGTRFNRDRTAEDLLLEIEEGEEYFGSVSGGNWIRRPSCSASTTGSTQSFWLSLRSCTPSGAAQPSDEEAIRDGFLRAARELLPSAHAKLKFRHVLDDLDARLGLRSILNEVPIPASLHVPQGTIQA